MRSVRLDPFSAKLLAIRTGHGKAPDRGPRLLDEEPSEPAVESLTVTDAVPESYEPPSLAYTPSRSAPNAPAREEVPIGAVMESVLSVHERAVAPTGCETCDEHAPTSIAELVKEIADLKVRVSSLEDSANGRPTYPSW